MDDVTLFNGAGGGGGMNAPMMDGNDRTPMIGCVGPSPARGSVRALPNDGERVFHDLVERLDGDKVEAVGDVTAVSIFPVPPD